MQTQRNSALGEGGGSAEISNSDSSAPVSFALWLQNMADNINYVTYDSDILQHLFKGHQQSLIQERIWNEDL